MIRSMTGFGKTILELQDKTITIEIRSLNSRYFDLSVKLPLVFKEKELELRNMLSQKIVRGKVDLYLTLNEGVGVDKSQKINKDLVMAYYNEMKEISEELGTKEDLLGLVMRLPNVLSTDDEAVDEELWGKVKKSAAAAADQLNDFREREGDELEKDLQLRLNTITENLNNIEALEPDRKERTKQRLKEQVENTVGFDKADENRFEEELIYYLEKMDITEEMVRLRAHIEYFNQVLQDEGYDKGKKLGFLGQELGREINTIGSKANDAAIQKLVVQMKDDLEKIKEQVLNVL